LTSDRNVKDAASSYADLHNDDRSTGSSRTSAGAALRRESYAALVNSYYDLATLFYEWGWCSSFHFATRFPYIDSVLGINSGRGESFYDAIRRHEYQLACQLQVFGAANDTKVVQEDGDEEEEEADLVVVPSTKPTASSLTVSSVNQNRKFVFDLSARPHILDVGCGIGGPMRNIARFLRCRVTGVTINQYQVDRGNALTAMDPTISHLCQSVQGDFMQLPAAWTNNFDGVYAIEATCHAPNRTDCYQEIYRVLKPGAIFATYEWCLLEDTFDPTNSHHLRLKKDIELGNGLPNCSTTTECRNALLAAGFELVRAVDMCSPDVTTHNNTSYVESWETPLMPSYNPLSQRFQFNPVGAVLTNLAIRVLEGIRLAPAGTLKTQQILQAGGFALRDAAQANIFTTAYLLVGRKPMEPLVEQLASTAATMITGALTDNVNAGSTISET
jgi:sterol 24-C-methyltransferase